ncbi:uncharacterized protein LOC135649293 [Musa acuminata AAA Group]|uniref:uncharacterized protein LOC135593554 n=1 Tax=Musa acuminata AAA Group TaxID=214697 RepID=UPI0031D973DB
MFTKRANRSKKRIPRVTISDSTTQIEEESRLRVIKERRRRKSKSESTLREEREWRSGVHRRRRVEGLAEAGRLGSRGSSRRRRIGAQVVSWWRLKVVFPVKRAWLAVSSRVRSQKHGGGILKLYDDVQMCGYQDVQVMWEILTRCEMETSNLEKQRKRSFCRRPSVPVETYG